MKKQLLAVAAALQLAAPGCAGAYSPAEIKKMFQQSADTEDMRLRVQLRVKIVENSPGSAYGLASRAFLLDQAGRISPEDEAKLYTKALELDPALAVAYLNRGILYSKLGYKEKALEDYKSAEKNGAKKALLYSAYGDIYLETGQNDLAIENYAKAIAVNPRNAFAYNNRGALYTKMKEYDKAIADLDAALKISTFAMAYMNRGDAYAGKKDYAAAFEDYKRAEALIPDSPDIYIRRGRIYYGIKEYGKAIGEYETAVGLDPHDTTALNSLGLACYYSGDFDRAEDAFKRSSAVEPGAVFAYEHIADVYAVKKLPDLAAQALAKAVELAPQRADLKEKLAAARRGGPAGSKNGDSLSLIRSGKSSAEDFYLSGDSLLETGDFKGAERELKAALRKSPDYPDAMIAMSLVMLRTNRRSEAIELFSSVMDTDPVRKRALTGLSASGRAAGASFRPNKLAILREMVKLYESVGE